MLLSAKGRKLSYVGNTISNYVGIVLLGLITFIGTPLLVKGLGDEDFALFRISIYTIVSYITLLDLGIGVAVRRNLGAALYAQDELRAKHVIGAGFLFYISLSIIVGIICIVLIYWLPSFLNVRGTSILPFRCLIGCAFVYSFIYLMQSLPCAVFIVKSRYDILQIPTIISSFILYFGAISLYPFLTQKLWGNCISSVAAQTIAFCFSIFMARKIWRGFEIKIDIHNFELIKSMLSFGFYGILIILVPIVLLQTQPIIMAKMLSFDDVTRYSIIIVLFTQMNGIIGASVSSVFTLALEQKQKGIEALKKLFIDSLGKGYFVWSLIAVPLFFYGGDFLSFWINSSYSSLSIPFRVLILASIFVPITMASNYMLNAVGNIRPLAVISISVLLLYGLINVLIIYYANPTFLIFLEILFLLYGIRGIFTGITVCKQFRVSSKEFLSFIIKLPFPTAIILAAGCILNVFFVPHNLLEILVLMGLLSCIGAIASFLFLLSNDDRKKIRDKAFLILNKIKFANRR